MLANCYSAELVLLWIFKAYTMIMQAFLLKRNLVQDGISNNAEDIASTLANMSEEIRLHLNIEDADIYPALLQHENAKVRELAAKYQMDMGQLLVVYQGFANKFTTAEQITADPEDFRKEANMVFQALFQRIKAENQNLYPAAMEALKA